MAFLDNLIGGIQERIQIDVGLDRLDRDLFYLPTRIQLEEYKKRLNGKKFKESERVGIKLETDFEINWESVIPRTWHEIGDVSQFYESPVKLITAFSKDSFIKSQTLYFTKPFAADILSTMFERSTNWESYIDNLGEKKLRTLDGKSIISVYGPGEEEFGIPTRRLLLLYKE